MDTSDSTTTASTLIAAGAPPPPPPLAVGTKTEGKEDKMEIEGAKTQEKGESKKVTLVGVAKGSGETASGGGEKRKSDEPDFQMIANPARVLPQQVSQNQLWGQCCYDDPQTN